MVATPLMCLPITITSSNKWVDLKDAGGAEESYSVPEATYTDIFALLAALDTAVGAGVAGFVPSVELQSDGKLLCKFVATGTIQFLWATGTHTAASLAAPLGFLAADTSAATTLYSTSPPPKCWCPGKAVRRDSRDQWTSVGGDFRASEDGTEGKRLEVAQVQSREVDFGLLAKELIWAADATGLHLNRDIETYWRLIVRAQSFRWFPDLTASGTYGTYFWDGPAEWARAIKRSRDDVEVYDVTLHMARKA